MSKLAGLHRVPLSVGPTGHHNMAENLPIEGSEYAGSESVTARELPDLHFMDNFESDSNESGINLWGSKVIYNEEIAQEGDP